MNLESTKDIQQQFAESVMLFFPEAPSLTLEDLSGLINGIDPQTELPIVNNGGYGLISWLLSKKYLMELKGLVKGKPWYPYFTPMLASSPLKIELLPFSRYAYVSLGMLSRRPLLALSVCWDIPLDLGILLVLAYLKTTKEKYTFGALRNAVLWATERKESITEEQLRFISYVRLLWETACNSDFYSNGDINAIPGSLEFLIQSVLLDTLATSVESVEGYAWAKRCGYYFQQALEQASSLNLL